MVQVQVMYVCVREVREGLNMQAHTVSTQCASERGQHLHAVYIAVHLHAVRRSVWDTAVRKAGLGRPTGHHTTWTADALHEKHGANGGCPHASTSAGNTCI